jgi:hypothetical protein
MGAMSSNQRLTGRVAAILNSRELVINIGAEQGVELDMKFRVLDEVKTVINPDTGKEIGEVQREKIRVKIDEVKENISIGRTYETYDINIGGSSGFFSGSSDIFRSLTPPQWVTRVKTLAYSSSDTGLDYKPLDESGSFVKIGDSVQQIID